MPYNWLLFKIYKSAWKSAWLIKWKIFYLILIIKHLLTQILKAKKTDKYNKVKIFFRCFIHFFSLFVSYNIKFSEISIFFSKIVSIVFDFYKVCLSPSVTYIMKFSEISIFFLFHHWKKPHLANSFKMLKRKHYIDLWKMFSLYF